jgi:hypothetical protein
MSKNVAVDRLPFRGEGKMSGVITTKDVLWV